MYLIQVTNYISNLLIQFYFRDLPFVGKSWFTSMRQIEIVIVTHWWEIKLRKQPKLSVCLQLTPHNINQKKKFTSSRNDERCIFCFFVHRSTPCSFLGDLAGTKLQSFVLGAPYQDGIKTSPFAVFSQDATVFLLVFGCATSKNPWDH